MFRKYFEGVGNSISAIALRSFYSLIGCPRAPIVGHVPSPAEYKQLLGTILDSLPPVRAGCRLVLVVLFVSVAWAYGQTSFEVTPLVGGRFGGTINLQQEGQANRLARLDNSLIFGVGAGFRFDSNDCESCSVVGFRWMRQNTHLGFKENSPSAALFRPPVTLDHFLGDFTQEFPINETQERVKPFVTAGLGAVRLSTPADSRTKLEFCIGGGVSMFFKPRWGLRFQAEYLPILMNAEVQKVVCAGGCVIALSGGVMNQLVVSVGPIFRLK